MLGLGKLGDEPASSDDLGEQPGAVGGDGDALGPQRGRREGVDELLEFGAQDRRGHGSGVDHVCIEQPGLGSDRDAARTAGAEVEERGGRDRVVDGKKRHAGCQRIESVDRVAPGRLVDQVRLRHDEQVGGVELDPNRSAGRRVVEALVELFGVDQDDDAVEAKPVGARPWGDPGRIGHPAELEYDVVGWIRPGPQRVERGGEPGREAAAHTSVGQLDGVSVAPADQGRVDVDRTDVVDEHGDRSIGAGEDRVDDGRLARAQIPTEERHRYPASVPRCHHVDRFFHLDRR